MLFLSYGEDIKIGSYKTGSNVVHSPVKNEVGPEPDGFGAHLQSKQVLLERYSSA